MDRAQVLTWAAPAEAGSEHPLVCPILVAAAAVDLPFTGLPEHSEPVLARALLPPSSAAGS
jgi:Cd2+/Zn2+-exporting ATPase